MQKQNSSMLGYLIPIVIVIGCFWYASKTIVPAYTENASAISTIEAANKANQAKLTAYKSAKTSLDSAKSTIEDINVAIPEDKDVPNLISELEQMAKRYGTNLPSIQMSDAGGSTVNISFAISGSIDGMQGFVKDVEADLKYFNIKSLTASSSPDGMSMSLQVETYKRQTTPVKGTGAAADTTAGATTNQEGI
jgi:Tfp pilus assembly protein PilO